MKICTKCKLEQPLENFKKEKSNKNKHRTICKNCDVLRTKYWRRNHKENVRRHNLKQDFNLTEKEYNQMLKNQNSCCAICKTNQSLLKRHLAVDHNHKTGKIRGLLCGNCNTALGLLKEDMDNITSLIDYLIKNET